MKYKYVGVVDYAIETEDDGVETLSKVVGECDTLEDAKTSVERMMDLRDDDGELPKCEYVLRLDENEKILDIWKCKR